MTNVARWIGVGVVLGLLSFATTAHADSVGTWRKVSYDVKGGWKVVTVGDKRYLELTKDFEVKAAPDLKIFLSPKKTDELTKHNVTQDALRLSNLSAFRGPLRFEIPAGADLDSYRSVVLYCEKYAVVFADSAFTK